MRASSVRHHCSELYNIVKYDISASMVYEVINLAKVKKDEVIVSEEGQCEKKVLEERRTMKIGEGR